MNQDFLQAYQWYNLAAALEDDKDSVFIGLTANDRDRAAKKLTPKQLARGQELSKQWLHAYESKPKLRVTPVDYNPFAEETEADKQLALRQKRSDEPMSSPDDATGRPAPKKSESKDAQSDKIVTGTGFVVSSIDGLVVTNAHVVPGCEEIRSPQAGKLQLVADDKNSDLALLRSFSQMPSPARVKLRAGEGIKTGENVTVFGFPLSGVLSDEGKVSTGVISSLSGLANDRRMIQISAPVQLGNSGGPLLDSGGRLIGVVVGKLDAIRVAGATGDIPQNVNFAINLATLRSFLDAHDVSYEVDTDASPKPTVDVVAEARKYAVSIECRQLVRQ